MIILNILTVCWPLLIVYFNVELKFLICVDCSTQIQYHFVISFGKSTASVITNIYSLKLTKSLWYSTNDKFNIRIISSIYLYMEPKRIPKVNFHAFDIEQVMLFWYFIFLSVEDMPFDVPKCLWGGLWWDEIF